MIKFSYQQVRESFHQEEPWANVFIFKYITLPLVFLVVNWTKISPNQITIFSGIFGILSGVFYSFNNLSLGPLFYLISYILDAIDGKVARITKKGSPAGAWIDICIDRVVFIVVSIGIGIGIAKSNSDFGIWLMAAIALMVGLFMLGFESRYNIQFHEILSLVKEKKYSELSKFRPAASLVKGLTSKNGIIQRYFNWTLSMGITRSPITLVELMIFLFCISPILGIYPFAVFAMILFLLIRLLVQQRFWIKIIFS